MAAVAAMAPSLVAVTNCLTSFVLLSPATNIPATLVLQSSLAIIYPELSKLINLAKFSF